MKYQKTSTSTPISTPISKQGHTTTVLQRLRRGTAVLFISALAFTACGNDGEPVSAGTSDTSENGIEDAADDAIDETPGDLSGDITGDEGETVQDRDENGELEDYEEAIADGANDPATDYVQPIDEPVDDETAAVWKRLIEADVVAADDIIDPQPWEIIQAFAVSADENEVIVRYEAGSPPCTQSRATVVETDTTIEVSLEVGLHPNIAAMSCIAQVVNSEIAVPLTNPVGDREVIAVQP